ncbi:unnamed protein product (macronuclear) [Paramecium tetraurelia]|uniref:C2HC/C3H-type domain-containing protein n=1 Tax=Paramecium tetraurelia TaxID=5888 RepID=A0EHI3_PARTE|nr:uncharacterized protein GSPATT00027098001 [Paramecium tetraurelia]CAK94774.1 unnamed protein product [Paramecium tetraurelia]|eukprot:XP_001462147.1 hypothetical protein (macronuclear) [Paramecium tetraurelia strain d4-2]
MEDQIDNEFLDENQQNQDLIDCELCNRKFHPERIERHLIACQKAQLKQQERDKIIQKKKKQIEQKKQQLQQMDVEIVKTNWREEHQKFQEQIQYNRKLKQLENEGQDVNQLTPPETKVNSNYVFCEYCERHFDKHVAERHIPKCKETKAKPKPPRKKTVDVIQPSQPQLQEKRQAQVSTPSTSSQMERKPIIKKQLSDSSQQFRPTSLQKFIAEQSGKANLTNIGITSSSKQVLLTANQGLLLSKIQSVLIAIEDSYLELLKDTFLFVRNQQENTLFKSNIIIERVFPQNKIIQ